MKNEDEVEQKIKITANSRTEILNAIEEKGSDLKKKLNFLKQKWGKFATTKILPKRGMRTIQGGLWQGMHIHQ